MNHQQITREAFRQLPASQVHSLVKDRKPNLTGIFVADGNRRLVTMETGLTPDKKDFYPAYTRIVTQYFKDCLTIFWGYGCHTLVFPLFGPSLLDRGESYREYVLPELVRMLAQDNQWLTFYDELGIKIRAYGYPERLDDYFPGLGLPTIIKQCEDHTKDNIKHRLFYGFFSHPPYDREFLLKVSEMADAENREPDRDKLARLYYGEHLEAADFLINSTKMASLGALPPFAYDNKTQVYTLVGPAIFALTGEVFREIIYDRLFMENSLDTGETLKEFYYRNRHHVFGLGGKIGGYRVPLV